MRPKKFKSRVDKNKKRSWLGLALLGSVVGLLLWVGQTLRSVKLAYQIEDLEKKIRAEEKMKELLEIKREKIISLHALENWVQNNTQMQPVQIKNSIVLEDRS